LQNAKVGGSDVRAGANISGCNGFRRFGIIIDVDRMESGFEKEDHRLCVFVAWGERGKREKAFNKVKSQLTTK
jgi:hypothetical protein